MDDGDTPDASLPDPSGYPTLFTEDGGWHGLVKGFHLGASIDAETTGNPPPRPTVTTLRDDEDGVVFGAPLVGGNQVSAEVTTSGVGLLDAWLDFNADGDWTDGGERIFAGEFLAAGINALSIPDSRRGGNRHDLQPLPLLQRRSAWPDPELLGSDHAKQ